MVATAQSLASALVGGKISEAEFAVRTITLLKAKAKPYEDKKTGAMMPARKSINASWSGFNAAWTTYFGTDPVAGTKRLHEEGIIVARGWNLSLIEDAPEPGVDVLKELGLR